MEKGSIKRNSKQDQPSPGVSKETITDKYSTCREDIAEVAIAAIQPCPIIPDYKEPTAIHPANHCADPERELLHRWMEFHRAGEGRRAIKHPMPYLPHCPSLHYRTGHQEGCHPGHAAGRQVFVCRIGSQHPSLTPGP